MTEEEPVPDRRRQFRNRIYKLLMFIVGAQTLYLTFHSHATALNEWPADLPNHSAYCRPATYKSCREGQWFGVLKSELPHGPAQMKELCQNWSDKPDSAVMRMIDATGGDTLYLCRMKDPARIKANSIP